MPENKFTGKTRGGDSWEPQFITGINQAECMGCGRCYKVCPRDVFELDESGADEADEDGFGDFGDEVVMVMALKNENDCIGCGSCFRVCPKSCHSHQPASELG